MIEDAFINYKIQIQNLTNYKEYQYDKLVKINESKSNKFYDEELEIFDNIDKVEKELTKAKNDVYEAEQRIKSLKRWYYESFP